MVARGPTWNMETVMRSIVGPLGPLLSDLAVQPAEVPRARGQKWRRSDQEQLCQLPRSSRGLVRSPRSE